MSTDPGLKGDPELLQLVDTRLRRVTTAIDGLDQRAARLLGVNRTDLRLLDLLAGRGPLTMTELGRAQGLSSGGVTVAVDRLTRSGYVRRRPHPKDRRSHVVELTPELLARAEPVFGLLQRRVRELLLAYSPEQLGELASFLSAWEEAILESGTA
ncbi:MAG: MarR family transcriptional regulator [Candidatus Dormiibacterota bacterium]